MIKFIEATQPTGNSRAVSVTIEIDGKRSEVSGWDRGDNITINGIAIRYKTGNKVWNGNVTYWKQSGNISQVFGPMDHRARRPSLHVVGFYKDFPESIQSQHN